MKRTKYSIFIILFALLCPSCNSRKKSSHNDREIIAELGEEVLYTDELNTIIKQELFDELNKIYEIKKKAVEQLINVKLLQKEADKKQLSYQQYIDNYTDNQIQRLGIDSLSKRYNLKSIIEFRDANMYNVATNSPTGKISGLYRLKGFIIDNLLDSLKQNLQSRFLLMSYHFVLMQYMKRLLEFYYHSLHTTPLIFFLYAYICIHYTILSYY